MDLCSRTVGAEGEDRYLVMIVSVDNKKADELEGKERVKTLNLEGGDVL